MSDGDLEKSDVSPPMSPSSSNHLPLVPRTDCLKTPPRVLHETLSNLQSMKEKNQLRILLTLSQNVDIPDAEREPLSQPSQPSELYVSKFCVPGDNLKVSFNLQVTRKKNKTPFLISLQFAKIMPANIIAITMQ